MQHQIHPNRIRQVFFLTVLIILGLIIVREMLFMLGAFLGAITLYVLMRNMMIKLTIDWRWKKWVAALCLILVSFVLLVIPTAWIISIGLERIKPIVQDPTQITIVFDKIHEYLILKVGLDILKKDNVAKISQQLLPVAQKTLASTLSVLGSLFMMYLMLFFLLLETFKVEKWIRHALPFKDENVQFFMNDFRSAVNSNAVGIPIVAIIQGVVGFIGYWIFGANEIVLMGILTAICSVIPLVGAMIIYVPIGIYLLSIAHTWQGVGILLWGFLLIGSIDNIARFMLQKRMANVHPLITLFGVLIGVNLFGFLGIIFGPLILSMFLLLVKIYINEFGKADASHPEKIIRAS
jgi:predicted PurR-regulated permease PerM